MKNNLNNYKKWLSNHYFYLEAIKSGESILVKFKKNSASCYTNDISNSIDDMGMIELDFYKLNTPGFINDYIEKLKKCKSFQNRNSNSQNNTISALKTYRIYLNTIK